MNIARDDMADEVKKLMARWSAPGGLPFKRKLISEDGCMCAQGQALHYVGGYTAEQLRQFTQLKADKETARILGISTAHSILLRQVNDTVDGAPSIVLTHPEKVLGDQAQTVLAFWRHLDQMTLKEWDAARDAEWVAKWDAAWDAEWVAALDAEWNAARVAAWVAAWDAALDAEWDAARVAAWVAARATNEIQGAVVMRKRGQPFFFLPFFGFDTPEEIVGDYSNEHVAEIASVITNASLNK